MDKITQTFIKEALSNPRKICLVGSMIIQEKLTYSDACKALDKAVENPKMNDWSFLIKKELHDGWTLEASHNLLVKEFLENPKDYIIEI
jgi:hypothetical protein